MERTRQSSAPKVWASRSATSTQSCSRWPGSIRTVTWSIHRLHRIATSGGTKSVPCRSFVRPMVSIPAAHRRRYTHEARHHARARMETWRSNETGQRTRHTTRPTTRPPTTPRGRAGWTSCQPATNATVRAMAIMAAGERTISSRSRLSRRASHSPRTAHSDTRTTCGRRSRARSSRPPDMPGITAP